MKTIVITSLLFLVSGIFSLHAQDASENLHLNRSVLKYYNGNDLVELSTEAPEIYEQMRNYFVNSYMISKVDCKECSIDMNEFFNRSLFNIVDFEDTRDMNVQIQIEFKEEYIITLLSTNELTALIEGAAASEMLEIKLDRPFPGLVDTGDFDGDYANYKTSLRDWIKDFPNEYRTLVASNELLRISLTEYISLPQDRKDTVLSNSTGYLITD
ncbi:MAG: hypothetical protein ACI837_002766 [Crocinitomicaceae bacterium]|jgi:hypothetical protein